MAKSLHNDEYYMKQSLKEAKTAFEEGEVPIGAVVVCNNKIIARGHNQVERLQDATAHAEMIAITSAQNFLGTKYLNECILYVTLEPCCMCAGGLFWTQIGQVVFGAKDKDRGFTQVNSSIIHPKTEIKQGILSLECEVMIKNFFKKLREH